MTTKFRISSSEFRVGGRAAVAGLLVGAAFLPRPGLGQGALTPPGAPAPTMKTLAQIEPRTPIGSLPYSITQPGSYYLTSNLTAAANANGITVNADGVTIDLMGFALLGGGGATGQGIYVPAARRNLAVRNGTVRGWALVGINADMASNSQLDQLRISDNGETGLALGSNSTVSACVVVANGLVSPSVRVGMSVGSGSTVRDCAASRNGNHGISTAAGCTVMGCTVTQNAGSGISAGDGSAVSGCTARSNGQDGIVTAFDCTVSRCTARRNDQHGISANTGSTVSECVAAFNGEDGIRVQSDCLVRSNNSRQNGRLYSSVGFRADGAGSRIEGNNATDNPFGFYCPGGGNILVRNTARANGSANYNLAGGNAVGVIVAVPASGIISGNSGGAGVGTTDPWANFSY